MPILNPGSAERNPAHQIWIAVGEPQAGQRHCGIEYRVGDQIRFLHLRFHYMLEDVLADQDQFGHVEVGLDDDNQKVFAGLALAIANASPQIPYAFDMDGNIFEPNGHFKVPPPGKGLTCATFVCAFFITHGIELLDRGTWPERPDDVQWQQSMVGILERHGAERDHIDAVLQNLGPRFRPEEVAGASSTDSALWPVSFNDAIILASRILQDLGEIGT